MHTTPLSLLKRLHGPHEEAAWRRFVELYSPLLYAWAQRFGLQPADAADLVQDVFTVLVRELPRFTYQPPRRFRGWLWTVFVNKWHERGRRRRPMQAASGVLADLAVPDGVEALCQAEYGQYVVRRVAELIQGEFQPNTWKAFWESVIADRPAAAVARELGMTENAVWIAKSRVLRRLRRELDGLLD
jgi:RNA polymerase sigma-70 factor (ECF subfamily)